MYNDFKIEMAEQHRMLTIDLYHNFVFIAIMATLSYLYHTNQHISDIMLLGAFTFVYLVLCMAMRITTRLINNPSEFISIIRLLLFMFTFVIAFTE